MFSKMLSCSIQWNWMVITAVKSSKCWHNFLFFGWTTALSLDYSFLLSSSLFISILFGCIFVWLALYSSFLVRWLRRNGERGQREVPARPGTMKRFRRHGHESQRDKHKQDLYQFNKVIKPTSSVESLFCCYTYTSSIIQQFCAILFIPCFLLFPKWRKVFCLDRRETLYVIEIAFLTQSMWEIQLHIHKNIGVYPSFLLCQKCFVC